MNNFLTTKIKYVRITDLQYVLTPNIGCMNGPNKPIGANRRINIIHFNG
jgi:hypothetical protein